MQLKPINQQEQVKAIPEKTVDFLVGDVAKILDLVQRVSPSLVDSLLLLVGFDLQQTSEPKSEDAPNNFYQPVAEDDRVNGDYGNLVVPSVSDWLDKNPLLLWGAIAGTLGTSK